MQKMEKNGKHLTRCHKNKYYYSTETQSSSCFFHKDLGATFVPHHSFYVFIHLAYIYIVPAIYLSLLHISIRVEQDREESQLSPTELDSDDMKLQHGRNSVDLMEFH
jgi:hypothetical protein